MTLTPGKMMQKDQKPTDSSDHDGFDYSDFEDDCEASEDEEYE